MWFTDAAIEQCKNCVKTQHMSPTTQMKIKPANIQADEW